MRFDDWIKLDEQDDPIFDALVQNIGGVCLESDGIELISSVQGYFLESNRLEEPDLKFSRRDTLAEVSLAELRRAHECFFPQLLGGELATA